MTLSGKQFNFASARFMTAISLVSALAFTSPLVLAADRDAHQDRTEQRIKETTTRIGATVMAVIARASRGIIAKAMGTGTSIGGMTCMRNAAMSVPYMFRRQSITNPGNRPASISFFHLISTGRGVPLIFPSLGSAGLGL